DSEDRRSDIPTLIEEIVPMPVAQSRRPRIDSQPVVDTLHIPDVNSNPTGRDRLSQRVVFDVTRITVRVGHEKTAVTEGELTGDSTEGLTITRRNSEVRQIDRERSQRGRQSPFLVCREETKDRSNLLDKEGN